MDFVADTVDFVVDFDNKSATTWIWQLVAVDFVADTSNFANTVDMLICNGAVAVLNVKWNFWINKSRIDLSYAIYS